MKIRNKMMLFIIPIMISCIILINIGFSVFFQNFILGQEKTQVDLINENLSSIVIENQKKYLGRINDWGHWDDTYEFIENNNAEYMNENLAEDTFINLDTNFFVFINKEGFVTNKKYYDFINEEFKEFPKDFLNDFNKLVEFSKLDQDTFGILQVGKDFYFVASSDITDSYITKQANGKMIMGRIIDQDLIATMEKNLGCRIKSISTIKNNESNYQQINQTILLKDLSYNEKKDTLILETMILNNYDRNSSVLITLTKIRDMYITGIEHARRFAFLNTLLFILGIIVVFILLGRYLSRPFLKLIEDVKRIDLNENELNNLPVEGKDEFLFLRLSINRILEKIHKEQSKVRDLSYHDQLTDLYNRRFFEEELKRLDTKRNFPLSFIYADLNGLKFINDAFGHNYGDQVILSVSKIFKKVCRSDDIIARIGGDEFVVLLPKTDLMNVEKLSDRIKLEINKLKIMDVEVSISLGWDTKYNEIDSTLDILKNAEDYMYQNKLLTNISKRNADIKSILNALLIKDPREKLHSKRVGMLCKMMGEAYNLSDDQITELETAGELHDIGKIILEKTLLNKVEKLTEYEWNQIKRHPEAGYRLLGSSNEFYKISEYILDHHERWDGTGYPKGLKGESINWEARIISIADAYDAMTSERPYRMSLSEEQAIEEIKKNAGLQFDPEISKVFIEKILGLKFNNNKKEGVIL